MSELELFVPPPHEWNPSLESLPTIGYLEVGEAWVGISGYTTYLRYFREGGGRYDHIAVTNSEGECERFPLHDPRVAPLANILLHSNFPVYSDWEPDEETLEWHAWRMAENPDED